MHRIQLPRPGLSGVWPARASVAAHSPAAGASCPAHQLRVRHLLPQTVQASYATSTSSSSSIPTSSLATSFYHNRILDQYTAREPKLLSLQQLVTFGTNMTPQKLLLSGNYVRTELPVRLAHRIRDLQNLPFIAGTNPRIEMVYELYWSAFDRLRKFPEILTMEDNERFCRLLRDMLREHLVVIPQLSIGMAECAPYLSADGIDSFMNRLLKSRVSRRVLAEQHLLLTERMRNMTSSSSSSSSSTSSADHGRHSQKNQIGVILTGCHAATTINSCARKVSEQFMQVYGVAPEVIIDGDADLTFTYIHEHIEYILTELLKNSMQATIETRRARQPSSAPSSSVEMPPIVITVACGETHIAFRVSDEGGGMDDHLVANAWRYSRTTSRFLEMGRMQSKMNPSTENSNSSSDPRNNHSNQADMNSSMTPASSLPKSNNHQDQNQHGQDPHVQEKQMVHLAGRMGENRPLARLGFGLPMSRVYANYLGGSLELYSMDGYGTDVYLRIHRQLQKLADSEEIGG